MCQDESEEKCDRCLLPLLFVATREKNRGEKRNASAVDCFLKYYFIEKDLVSASNRENVRMLTVTLRRVGNEKKG